MWQFQSLALKNYLRTISHQIILCFTQSVIAAFCFKTQLMLIKVSHVTNLYAVELVYIEGAVSQHGHQHKLFSVGCE